jgi:hypothetical protein
LCIVKPLHATSFLCTIDHRWQYVGAYKPMQKRTPADAPIYIVFFTPGYARGYLDLPASLRLVNPPQAGKPAGRFRSYGDFFLVLSFDGCKRKNTPRTMRYCTDSSSWLHPIKSQLSFAFGELPRVLGVGWGKAP